MRARSESPDDIDHVEIGTAPRYILVAKSHRLARRARFAFAELVEEPVVLLDLPHSGQDLERLLSLQECTQIRHRTSRS